MLLVVTKGQEVGSHLLTVGPSQEARARPEKLKFTHQIRLS